MRDVADALRNVSGAYERERLVDRLTLAACSGFPSKKDMKKFFNLVLRIKPELADPIYARLHSFKDAPAILTAEIEEALDTLRDSFVEESNHPKKTDRATQNLLTLLNSQRAFNASEHLKKEMPKMPAFRELAAISPDYLESFAVVLGVEFEVPQTLTKSFFGAAYDRENTLETRARTVLAGLTSPFVAKHAAQNPDAFVEWSFRIAEMLLAEEQPSAIIGFLKHLQASKPFLHLPEQQQVPLLTGIIGILPEKQKDIAVKLFSRGQEGKNKLLNYVNSASPNRPLRTARLDPL